MTDRDTQTDTQTETGGEMEGRYRDGIKENEKTCRTVRRGAKEQQAEAHTPLAAADLGPCRDSFH